MQYSKSSEESNTRTCFEILGRPRFCACFFHHVPSLSFLAASYRFKSWPIVLIIKIIAFRTSFKFLEWLHAIIGLRIIANMLCPFCSTFSVFNLSHIHNFNRPLHCLWFRYNIHLNIPFRCKQVTHNKYTGSSSGLLAQFHRKKIRNNATCIRRFRSGARCN